MGARVCALRVFSELINIPRPGRWFSLDNKKARFKAGFQIWLLG